MLLTYLLLCIYICIIYIYIYVYIYGTAWAWCRAGGQEAYRSDRGTPVALLLAFSRVGMMLLSLGVVSCKSDKPTDVVEHWKLEEYVHQEFLACCDQLHN